MLESVKALIITAPTPNVKLPPGIKPNFSGPAVSWGIVAVDLFLGVIVIGLIGVFFAGIGIAAISVLKKKDSGPSNGLAASGFAILALVVVFGGTAILAQFVNLFPTS
jgi:hypothetical protein